MISWRSTGLPRTDLESSIAQLRAEMEASVAAFRAEMEIRFARLEERIAGLATREYALRTVVLAPLQVFGMLIAVLVGVYRG